ncbi:MAG TPA: hypothetical protein VF125_04700 [Solirubrobacterales bacterium]
MVSLVLAVTALASCGGGGEREALEAMIRAATVDSGPGSCLKYETLHFLETMYRREGEAAVRACEESALDPRDKEPRSIDVSEIDIAGDSAAAVIGFEGSLMDGQKVRYGLVNREGKWKFDEMVGFVDLDAAHLVLELGREGLLRAETPREAENVSCWIGRMERMSDEALEELLLGDRDVSARCTAKSNAI